MKEQHTDVVLIGAGIMSATLAEMLRTLEPDWKIEVFERLDQVARESSDAMNNAGTGHSAFCELNYTPQLADGSVDVSKALKIAEQFETSKEFWAALAERGVLKEPGAFIKSVPHMSLVWGEENVAYLRKRHQALTAHHLFRGMKYSEDHEQLRQWIPLIMEGRDPDQKLAATLMEIGTDVNFGSLTRAMFDHLEASGALHLHCAHEVRDIDREADGLWHINVKDLKSGKRRGLAARFVFIGAGGGTLPLLERTGIPEANGLGGFPVSGQWLVCKNPAVVERHAAKVYGKAAVGSPPMSVPHLDTRVIDGKKALLFGPYAGFSTRFLKQGSLFDLPGSITPGNVGPMISAGLHNLPLTRYLVEQVMQSPQDRLEALRDFVPTAQLEEWELETAGQRVQVIKKDKKQGGVLEFGTELVVGAEGTMSALLGASPGASTAVWIMLELVRRCFPDKVQSAEWQTRLQEMIPSYGQSLITNEELALRVRRDSAQKLGLRSDSE